VNLVRAEAVRLATRRLTWAVLLLLLAAFAATLATTASHSYRPSGTEIAYAESQAARERAWREQEYPRCLALAGDPRQCDRLDPAGVSASDYLYGVFVFSHSIRPAVGALAAYLAVLAFLLGASSIGAEMASGGVADLLLWRPRRLAVFSAKLAVLLGVVLAVAVTVTAVHVGGFWLLARLLGSPGTTTAAFWGDLAWMCLRVTGLALVAAALGFAAAVVGQRTAAATGLLAVYAAGWEVGGRLVLDASRVRHHDGWFLTGQLAAWVDGAVTGPGGGSDVVTWSRAGMLLAALGVLGVGLAAVVFHRRDLA
jgi:hypothetical protein